MHQALSRDDLGLMVVATRQQVFRVCRHQVEEEHARAAKRHAAVTQALLYYWGLGGGARHPPAQVLHILNVHFLARLIRQVDHDPKIISARDAEVLLYSAAHCLQILHLARSRTSRTIRAFKQIEGRGSACWTTTSSEMTGCLSAIARLLLQPLVLLEELAVQLRLCTALDVAGGLCRTLTQPPLHSCQPFLGLLQLPSRGTLAQAIGLPLRLAQLRLCGSKLTLQPRRLGRLLAPLFGLSQLRLCVGQILSQPHRPVCLGGQRRVFDLMLHRRAPPHPGRATRRRLGSTRSPVPRQAAQAQAPGQAGPYSHPAP